MKKESTGSVEYKTCIGQFQKNNRLNLLLSIFFGFLSNLLYIAVAFLMLIVVEAMEASNIQMLWVEIPLTIVILLLFVLVSRFLRVFRNRYITVGLNNFKFYVFKRLLEKPIGIVNKESSGGILSAFSNDINQIELNYLNGIIEIINNSILFVLSLAAMMYINFTLACFVLAACTLPMTIALVFGNKLGAKESSTSLEGASFIEQVKDLLNGFVVIKSFKAEKEALEIFQKRNIRLESMRYDKRSANDSVRIASSVSSVIIIAMIFTVGQYLAFTGVISVGAVIAFVQLSSFMNQPIEKVVPLISNRKASKKLIEKIACSIEPEEIEKKEYRINGLNDSISFKNVSFAYHNDKAVLQNINMVFDKGKSYAIVGASGCGKSTLLKLLQGFYPNYDGEILYDGVELNNIDSDSLFENISVIQQNVFLFNSSIRNNITMFKNFSEDQVERAVKLAGLSKLIEEKGMDYICGEGGCNLSGGEKQRISIARGLLRSCPVILVDEATASLDNYTAIDIEKALLSIDGPVKIVVTHKLQAKTISEYDKIVIVKENSIVECGAFNELMQQKGYFYALYNSMSV